MGYVLAAMRGWVKFILARARCLMAIARGYVCRMEKGNLWVGIGLGESKDRACAQAVGCVKVVARAAVVVI